MKSETKEKLLIILNDVKYVIYQRKYRNNPKVKEEARKEIDDLIEEVKQSQ